MSRIVRKEIRQRGFFGHIAKWLFIVFNLFMGLVFFMGMSGASQGFDDQMSDAGKAGAAIGTFIGASLILGFWAAGSLILGLLALLTRGNKTIIEEEEG
jgi:hypothetical protein